MYIMYVDESGDIGLVNSPTKYYILSALVVHENRWYEALDELIEFRKMLRNTKKLKLREEIHAAHFINKPGELIRIPMYERVDILKQCIQWINNRKYLNVFSIRIDKTSAQYDSKEKVFETAWNYLIQRFENTLEYRNFNGPNFGDDKGIIFTDKTDEVKLKLIYRKMRKFNPVPNNRELFMEGSRMLNVKMIIEDPVHRDSNNSYFIQLVDVIAYMCFQKYQANSRAKSKGLHNYYKRLDEVLTKVVSKKNDLAIVEV